jgi:UDP-galactopyranose mutase
VNDRYSAKTIISTIPWTLWPKATDVPAEIKNHILKLVHIPIDIDYRPENIQSDAHWIYEPREVISYHRILVRHNFCPGARGYWTETNSARNGIPQHFRHRNEFAYPVNTCAKPEAIKAILAWAKTHNVIGAGRWGTWEHMNSDIAVHEAMLLAEKLVSE